MSLTPEENKTTEQQEQSTIFGASPVKDEKRKAPKKNKMLKTALSAFLALAVLVGGTVAVIELIPEKKDEENTPNTDQITIFAHTDTDVESVTVDRTGGTVVYTSVLEETKTESESSTEAVWSIDGVDAALIDESSLSSHIDSLITMNATREIEKEDGADYGFSAPLYKLSLKLRDGGEKSLLLGNKTPSASGFYAQVAGEDKVYLVSTDIADLLDSKNEDFSITTVISAQQSNTGTEKYFSDSKLTLFDTLTLARKGEKTVSFVSSFESDTNQMLPYTMVSPINRSADTDTVGNLVSLVSGGLTATSAYAFNPTAKDLQLYGMENPDLVLELKYGKNTIKFSATKQADGDYAVMTPENSKIIFKVAASNLTFADTALEDFLSSMPFIEMINNFESFTFETANGKNVFTVSYEKDENDEERIASVKANGKAVETEQFQTYYQHLVGTEPSDAVFQKVDGKADFTIFCKARNGEKDFTLKFIKDTDRRYYFEINGDPVGLVSTTHVEKLMNYQQDLANGKTIPEY